MGQGAEWGGFPAPALVKHHDAPLGQIEGLKRTMLHPAAWTTVQHKSGTTLSMHFIVNGMSIPNGQESHLFYKMTLKHASYLSNGNAAI